MDGDIIQYYSPTQLHDIHWPEALFHYNSTHIISKGSSQIYTKTQPTTQRMHSFIGVVFWNVSLRSHHLRETLTMSLLEIGHGESPRGRGYQRKEKQRNDSKRRARIEININDNSSKTKTLLRNSADMLSTLFRRFECTVHQLTNIRINPPFPLESQPAYKCFDA